MSEHAVQATFKLRRARLLAPEPQPWRRDTPPLAEINPVPSMICEDEARFLHWIARHHLSGEGQIVDLGPLAGGSTHALCSGLALNGDARERSRVHSYDLWRFFPGWEPYFPGGRLKAGDDLYPLFRSNLEAYGALVAPHPGDLRTHRWRGGPIEILFIDAAKAFGLWTHILREFFPRCPPGALIVHQDWVCAECPWIHLTMARLSDYVAPVDSPDGGTVAFRVERPIPASLLAEKDFLAVPAASARARFEQAASWMVGWYALEVRLAEAHYHAMKGEGEEAARLVDEVLAHPEYAPRARYDVDLVLAAVRKPPARESSFRRVVRRAANAIGIR